MNRLKSVITPLPDAAHSAFLSPLRWDDPPHPSLVEAGYLIEEFIVAGEARMHTATASALGAQPLPLASYRTRAIVIRPARDEHFSGVVHIELLNPSTGVDFPMFWPDAGFHLVARGDAYIGITCKSVTVEALRRIDPSRYGDLHIPHDGVVWDLLGAVAAAARLPGGGGLLDGLRSPERLVATGWSQSGSFLRTYLSEGLHELHSAESAKPGAPIIDAYLIGVSSGGFGPMGYVDLDRDGEIAFDRDLMPLERPVRQIPMDDQRRWIRGIGVPVFEFMSEDEARHHLWHQRPDSDTPADRYRCLQIPGRGHETGLMGEAARRTELAESGFEIDTEYGPPRHEASRWLIAAALEHLIAWTEGVVPPRADPIAASVRHGFRRDPEGLDYSGTEILRDADGHALGGVRYLEIDLPLARMSTDPESALTMRDWRHEPLGEHERLARYGSADEYRMLLRERSARLVRDGWLLPQHVAPAISAIMRSFSPRHSTREPRHEDGAGGDLPPAPSA